MSKTIIVRDQAGNPVQIPVSSIPEAKPQPEPLNNAKGLPHIRFSYRKSRPWSRPSCSILMTCLLLVAVSRIILRRRTRSP